MKYIALYASLTATLRAVIKVYTDSYGHEKRTQITQNLKEHPIRLTQQLYTVAISNAINHGRRELNSDDLSIIKYIALNSIPEDRMLALKALLKGEFNCDGLPTIKKSDLVKALNISDYRAKDIIKNFGLLGICDIEEPDEAESDSGDKYYIGEYSMTLKEEYKWLLDKEVWGA